MRLTIAFTTARSDPRVEWMLESLQPQVKAGDEIELIVVDSRGRGRAELVPVHCPWLTAIRVVPSKPNVWCGPHRLASRDLCDIASARNTAIVLAQTNYVAFLDDRCWLDPSWLASVRRGYDERVSVLVGPYDKSYDVGGLLDHRRSIAPMGQLGCGGSWLFGGNFCLPLAWLLEVNGFEEACDPTGCEDYVLGCMLANAGHRIDLDMAMSLRQDRTGQHNKLPTPRVDTGVTPNDRSHEINRRFLPLKRTEITPDLTALRTRIARGEGWPVPDPTVEHRDWYDGMLVREMGQLAVAARERGVE